MNNAEIRLRCNGKTQSRTGKVARLPHKIREEVNRRLRDNVPGHKICEWLNRLPAAKAVCKEFARHSGKERSPITPNQLSEWRRGGFQDWLREQQMLTDTREMARWSMRLAKDSGGNLSEGAAVLLSGQLLRLLQGMAALEGIGIGNIDPSSLRFDATGHRTLNIEHRASDGDVANEALRQTQELPEAPGVIPSRRPEGRAPENGVERVESSVRILGALVKCLSGIRRGDQNRVRLAQLERKLVLRSNVVAMECEQYEKEKAKQEELERQQRAAERRKKRCRLTDAGKIDLIRGKLFGPDLVVKEREEEIKRLQKELEILKAEMPPSRSSDGHAPHEAPSVQAPSVQRSSKDQVPSSNATSAVPSGCEPIRVDTSAYDQSVEKSGSVGESKGGSATGNQIPKSNVVSAQGAKKFDAQAALREVKQIEQDLAELQSELPADESSSEHLQEQNSAGGESEPEAWESKVRCPMSNVGSAASGEASHESVWANIGEAAEWLRKFDPEALLRELEEIKQEVAVLKARRRVGEGGAMQTGARMEDRGSHAEPGELVVTF